MLKSVPDFSQKISNEILGMKCLLTAGHQGKLICLPSCIMDRNARYGIFYLRKICEFTAGIRALIRHTEYLHKERSLVIPNKIFRKKYKLSRRIE